MAGKTNSKDKPVVRVVEDGRVVAESDDKVLIAFVKVVAMLEGQTPRAQQRILNFVNDVVDEESS